MSRRASWLLILVTALAVLACNDRAGSRTHAPRDVSNLPPDERDASRSSEPDNGHAERLDILRCS